MGTHVQNVSTQKAPFKKPNRPFCNHTFPIATTTSYVVVYHIHTHIIMQSTASEFAAVIAKTYKEQAVFFLNAFWPEYSGEGEQVWKYVQKFVELDQAKGKEGNDLDEFNSHRFLEFWNETATVQKMREMLRELNLDRHKRMSLIEYLLVKYKQTVKVLLSRPQVHYPLFCSISSVLHLNYFFDRERMRTW